LEKECGEKRGQSEWLGAEGGFPWLSCTSKGLGRRGDGTENEDEKEGVSFPDGGQKRRGKGGRLTNEGTTSCEWGGGGRYGPDESGSVAAIATKNFALREEGNKVVGEMSQVGAEGEFGGAWLWGEGGGRWGKGGGGDQEGGRWWGKRSLEKTTVFQERFSLMSRRERGP